MITQTQDLEENCLSGNNELENTRSNVRSSHLLSGKGGTCMDTEDANWGTFLA